MSVRPSVGMSVYQNVDQSVLCEQFIPFFLKKIGICFAHELMCMWLGILHFFHLMNIHVSILGISDAVDGCFREHTSSDLILFLVHSCPFIYYYNPPLKSAGHCGIPSVQKVALNVRPSVRPLQFRFRSLS